MKNLLYFLVIIGVASCKSDSVDLPYNSAGEEYASYFDGEKSLLLGKEWKLTGFETGEVSHSTILEFKAQKNQKGSFIVSGKSAVNFYEAGYELTGVNGIKVTNLSITEIAGNATQTVFEKDFFDRLANVETFRIKDGTLVLSNRSGQQLYFKSN